MWDYFCTLPPEHHSTANAEPDSSSGEMASEQMNNRLEPRGNGEAKGEPIEQHHEHEEYRYRPHFPILSPTPSVAPTKPGKLTAVCLAGTGKGCSRQQRQQ